MGRLLMQYVQKILLVFGITFALVGSTTAFEFDWDGSICKGRA